MGSTTREKGEGYGRATRATMVGKDGRMYKHGQTDRRTDGPRVVLLSPMRRSSRVARGTTRSTRRNVI
jgi:hypothetical protein